MNRPSCGRRDHHVAGVESFAGDMGVKLGPQARRPGDFLPARPSEKGRKGTRAVESSRSRKAAQPDAAGDECPYRGSGYLGDWNRFEHEKTRGPQPTASRW